MTAKETHRAYLQSDHWKRLKCELNIRCGRRCETCNHDGSLWPIDGHHLIYRTPLELGTVDELLGLCRRCHDIVHDLNLETWFAIGAPLEVRRETTIREIRRYLPELSPTPPKPKVYPRLKPGQVPRIHQVPLPKKPRHTVMVRDGNKLIHVPVSNDAYARVKQLREIWASQWDQSFVSKQQGRHKSRLRR